MRRIVLALGLTACLGFATPAFGAGLSEAPRDSAAPELGEAESPEAPESPDEHPEDEAAASQEATDAEAPERLNSQSSKGTSRDTYRLVEEAAAEVDLDPESPTIVGVSWEGDGELTTRVRTKVDGEWGAWEALPVNEDGPEPGSEEAKNARPATVPTNVTSAEAVQVDATEQDGTPADVQLSVVSTDVTEADKSAAEGRSASALARPSGTSVKPPTIVTRKGWGADESLKPCSTDVGPTVRSVAIHHTVGSNSYTKAQAPGIVRGVYSYHTQSQGWCDVGYNFLVDKYGTVYEGRGGSIDESVIGAHASGFNSGSMGISIMGTHTSTAVTSATQSSLKRWIAWMADRWGFTPTGKHTATSGGGSSKYPAGRNVTLNNVWGHRDTGSTECPGGRAYELLGSLRSGAKTIYDNEGTVTTKGAIGTKYRTVAGILGDPVANERCGLRDGGCYQVFENGQIHWSSKTGAWMTKGSILSRWRGTDYENGKLGYPTSDERCGLPGNGCYQVFEKGQIHWSGATGSAATWGSILSAWKNTGYERGPLGYPLTATEKCGLRSSGCYQTFQNSASIHWTSKFGAHPTRGGIRSAWSKSGWQDGPWGYPKSSEYTLNGVTVQDFEFGRATWQNGQATFRKS